MLPQGLLRQIRRLQLLARHTVEDLLGGEYRSVFKGRGIVFEEVRAYQPGDDVRAIDWNVTARMGQPFVKRFIEERELTVMLVVDSSGSQEFGTGLQRKREVAAELAAVLAFAAISNNDRIGLISFSDEVERFVPPRKGLRHGLRVIRDVLYFQGRRRKTSIQAALEYLNRVTRRRAIVILVSDFLDEGYEGTLKRTARRHDVIAIRITDPRETELPAVGLLELEDAETGRRLLVNTASAAARAAFAAAAEARRDGLERWAPAAGIDMVEVSTEGGHLDALVQFFQRRQRRWRRT
jgi:uncharacterized protein (DUF58 family)